MFLQSTEAQELASRSADVLHLIDSWRLEVNRQLDPRRKVELGQFLTPMPVAQLMASMLECHEPGISLLDPCAGVGSLFAACIAELCQRSQRPHNIHVTAYELDPTLAAYLPETLRLCEQLCESAGIVLTGEIRHEVISPHDPQSCIRIVSDEGDQQIAKRMATLPATLEDLGIEVSTGRVVDFRVEALLRLHPEEGTVPLLYPAHISSGEVVWPSQEVRKPGALVVTDQSRDLLVPNEPYVLVRRFSSKEEKRRVVAVLYEPQVLPASHVAFENHLNYFHQHGRGLDPLVAKGLTAFLNSTFVDIYFRLFNGYTQVNATDLQYIRYPTRRQLAELATRLPAGKLTQQTVDTLIEEILPLI